MDPLNKVSQLAATKTAVSLVNEFKKFALKGNVIDLAIGVIIGAAFGKIVDSLVKHIIMPVISLVLPGEQSYLSWKIVVGAKEIPYGLFLGEMVNFLLVAIALFIFMVKFLGWVMKHMEHEAKMAEAVSAPAMTKEQELLTEIRDLLKKQSAS